MKVKRSKVNVISIAQPCMAAVVFAAAIASTFSGAPQAEARSIAQAGDLFEAEQTASITARPPSAEPARGVAQASPPKSVPPAPIEKSTPEPAPVVAPMSPAMMASMLKKIGPVPTITLATPDKEVRFVGGRYALPATSVTALERFVAQPLETPEMISAKDMAALTKAPVTIEAPRDAKAWRQAPGTAHSRVDIDRLSIALTAEKPFALKKHAALTSDEFRFLSGLLLLGRGDQCAVAAGLFYKFSKAPASSAQANYYLATCSKSLGFESDYLDRARRVIDSGHSHYAPKMLGEMNLVDLPDDFIIPFGAALSKSIGGEKPRFTVNDAAVLANARYWLAAYGARVGQYKLTLAAAAKVPPEHPKRLRAQFLLALAEHESGNKEKALHIEEDIVAKSEGFAADREFASTAALNLARMEFQERQFKPSTLNFLKVSKEHPLWLQSLTEMGWAQLEAGDFEGAIGNMYSIQSPYFKSVYKPESFVIRTIGYLNLCQYGDAYRTLTRLEKQYRPWLEKMDAYVGGTSSRTAAVRRFIESAAKEDQEIDGLPVPVLREMARHKDFLAQQKSLNARIDERGRYAKLTDDAERSLTNARAEVTASRKRIADIKAKILSIAKNAALEPSRLQWHADLEREFDALNSRFFDVEVMNEAKLAVADYRAEASAAIDARVGELKKGVEVALVDRLRKIRQDLKQILENNELLRYEVFAGSGENIRYQIGGGQKGNRVPAEAIPQSKSLHWDFDGEYWEDEVGHYRSSLHNNCPDAKRAQAALDGTKGEGK